MWLLNGQGAPDGLLIPGRPARSAASLCLKPDAVELQAPRQSAELPWESYESNWTIDPWAGTFWSVTRDSGDIIGVYVKSDLVAKVGPLLMALAVSRKRFTSLHPAAHAFDDQPVVPLNRPRVELNFTLQSERSTIWALCRLLATRPELRTRLGNQDMMTRLIQDMAANAVVRTDIRGGALAPASADIATAIRSAGTVHPIGGRPVPGDKLIPRGEAVDRVMASLHGNQYRKGSPKDESRVGEELDKCYYNVAPWPFAELVR